MQPHLLLALPLLLSPTIKALTLPPHNLTILPPTLTGHSIRNCVADPTWNPPSLLISPSCSSALLELSADAATLGPDPGLFIYNNGHSRAFFVNSDNYEQELSIPKRYVSGQCVVAVVMMKMFEEAGVKVPGLPRGRWPDVEEVGWEKVVEGGRYVRGACANGCGYATVGRRDGVAVVVWEVGSWWDRFVGGGDVGTA